MSLLVFSLFLAAHIYALPDSHRGQLILQSLEAKSAHSDCFRATVATLRRDCLADSLDAAARRLVAVNLLNCHLDESGRQAACPLAHSEQYDESVIAAQVENCTMSMDSSQFALYTSFCTLFRFGVKNQIFKFFFEIARRH